VEGREESLAKGRKHFPEAGLEEEREGGREGGRDRENMLTPSHTTALLPPGNQSGEREREASSSHRRVPGG